MLRSHCPLGSVPARVLRERSALGRSIRRHVTSSAALIVFAIEHVIVFDPAAGHQAMNERRATDMQLTLGPLPRARKTELGLYVRIEERLGYQR